VQFLRVADATPFADKDEGGAHDQR